MSRHVVVCDFYYAPDKVAKLTFEQVPAVQTLQEFSQFVQEELLKGHPDVLLRSTITVEE